MRTRRILIGTPLAAVALCCAICGCTATVDTVPAPAAESAVSAPCAPQTRSSSNNIITEPVTQPETVEVTGSATSPEVEYPQTTPTSVPASTPAEEPAAELPATISKPTEETPPAQDGMVYVPSFGYLKSEGPCEWSVSEDMYENGNKVGIME